MINTHLVWYNPHQATQASVAADLSCWTRRRLAESWGNHSCTTSETPASQDCWSRQCQRQEQRRSHWTVLLVPACSCVWDQPRLGQSSCSVSCGAGKTDHREECQWGDSWGAEHQDLRHNTWGSCQFLDPKWKQFSWKMKSQKLYDVLPQKLKTLYDTFVSAVSVMSWSINCPQITRRMVTAWSW